jgi:outer membrane protein assembly factor BamA
MILLVLPCYLGAQDYYLEFDSSASDLQVIKKYNLKFQSSDSLFLVNQLQELEHLLQSEGYLTVKISSYWQDGQHLKAKLTSGEMYRLVNLYPGNVAQGILQKIGYREKLYSNQPFKPQQVQELMQRLIGYAGDSGYPFATVKLDSVQISNAEIFASLLFDPGPLITFDSIVLNQPVKINPRFLQAYLKISPGTPFSESLIDELPSRLSKLPYLELTEAPMLTFQNDQASTYLTLKPIKANQIDGVIGFLPNAKNDGGMLLTGQFNLKLQNMFGSGRSLGFQWESFKPESQQLNIDYHQPALFRSPIELDFGLNLFKEDSTFVNRTFNFDLGYLNRERHFIGFYTHIKAARLPSSGLLEDVDNFPDIADFNLNQFGGSYRWDNLDNYLEPRSGVQVKLKASTGVKKIKQNSAIEDSLYQQLDLETNQFSWEAELQGYFPVAKRWILAARWVGAGVYNDRLFFNDLYRIGGLKSIRGFSENSFFADNFAYSSLEPRFVFDTRSYLFVFYDQAWWLRYSLENNQFKDRPSGFGAGISLTTGAGIFNFAWAVGSSETQNLGFDQSKIHFGYISRF